MAESGWTGGRPILGVAVAGVGRGRSCWLVLGAMAPPLLAAGLVLGEAWIRTAVAGFPAVRGPAVDTVGWPRITFLCAALLVLAVVCGAVAASVARQWNRPLSTRRR